MNACFEGRTKPTSTFHGQNAEFFDVKDGGVHSNRSAVRGINEYVICFAQK